jgi:translocation and assembly module TamB
LRWLLLALAGLVLLGLLVVMGAVGWLSTPSGRAFVLERVEGAVPGLTLEGAEGGLFDLRLARLTIGDGKGPWLVVEGAALDWAPFALLRRTLRVEGLTAGRVDLSRLPETKAGEDPAAEPDEPFHLPLDVAVERLAVDSLTLGADLLGGEAATLRLAGSATLPAGEPGGSATLAAERIDDRPGTLSLTAAYIPNRRLTLDLRAGEPAGGVIATLLGIPGTPPVAVELAGDGPPTDWTGTLTARAGDVASATAEARIRPAGGGFAFGLDAGAAIAALLPPEQAVLAGDRIGLAAGGFILPGEILSLDGITLTTAAGTIAGQGVYRLGQGLDQGPDQAPDQGSLNFGFHGVLAPDSPVRDLLQGPRFGRAEVTGRAAGPAAAPDITATLSVLDPAVADWRADRLTLTANLDPADPAAGGLSRFALAADAVVEGAVLKGAAQEGAPEGTTPALAALLGPRVQAGLAGSVTTADGGLVLDRVTIDAAALDLSGSGTLGGWGRSIAAQATLTAPDLRPFGPLAGLDLTGAVSAEAKVSREDGGDLGVAVTALAQDPGTGIPAADALLSPETRIVADAALPADDPGAMILHRLRLEGGRATLTAEAALTGGTLRAAGEVRVPDLSPLGRALGAGPGTGLAGSAALTAKASGPLDALTAEATLGTEGLVLNGRRYGTATAKLSAAGLPAAPSGTLTLDGAIRQGNAGDRPLALAATFAMAGDRLRLPELIVMAGRNRLTGSVTADLATTTAEGDLAADLPDLALLGALAGQRLDGNATARIRLTTAEGRQRAALTARLADITRRTADGTQTLARLDLTGDYTAASGRSPAALDLRAEGGGIAVGDLRLETLTATAAGPLTGMRVALVTEGAAGAPLALDMAATVARQDTDTTITLDRLAGRYDGTDFQAQPGATIDLAGQGAGFAVAGLAVTLAGAKPARLELDADLRGQRVAATVAASAVPLALARFADPTLVLGGTIDGRITLAGTATAPTADIALDVRNFSTAPDRPGLRGIDAAVTGRWAGERLALRLSSTGGERIDLTGEVDLPLVPVGGPLSVTVPPGGRIGGRAAGSLDMALLNDVLATSGDRVAGRLGVDLSLGGTVADTDLTGTVAIDDGRYENQLLGTAIDQITARLEGDPDGLVIRRFDGRTPNGGTLRLDGAVRFDPDFGDRQIDLTLVAERARVAQTDLVTADADATLTLRGSARDAELAGEIGIRQAYITLPDTLPRQVVDLEVVEVNGQGVGGDQETDLATGPASAGGDRVVALRGQEDQGLEIGLRLTVSAPNEIYLRGRGADAEFKAALQVDGTVAAPLVQGSVDLIKGDLSILGQTLTLERATASFTGDGSLTPVLDIEARTTRGEATAIVAITGTPDQPKVALSSEPPLPEDEVLANLLFGRGIGQLSAIEAVQLAQGAGQLAGVFGSGPGVVDRVRRGLGVDRLEFKGSETGGGLGSVAAGRYVGDDLYVGVQQDLDSGQSQATVEYDINDNIRLRGEVGRQSKVGVQFEWDY